MNTSNIERDSIISFNSQATQPASPVMFPVPTETVLPTNTIGANNADLERGDKIGKSNPAVTTAYFSFGRYQPPTLGHGFVISQIASDAAKNGGDAYVFISSSQDSTDNPLPVGRKVYWMKRMMPLWEEEYETPMAGVRIINTDICPKVDDYPIPQMKTFNCRNPMHAASALHGAGYTLLKMYVGEDRFKSFSDMFAKSADVEVIKTADERVIITGSNVGAISGTKMRNAAVKGRLGNIKSGTKLGNINAARLAAEIKAAINVGKFEKSLSKSTVTRTISAAKKGVAPKTKRANKLSRGRPAARTTRRGKPGTS